MNVVDSSRPQPEQRDVVAHRLGQVAGLAQLLHRRRAVALGELLAVGAVQQRQVGVHRRLGAQRLQHHHLARGVREVVLAADHVGDPHVEVVDRHREVVERAAVRAGDHEVVDRLVREASPRRGSRRSPRSPPRRAPAAAPRPRPRRRGRRPACASIASRWRGARSAWEIGPSSQSSPSQRSASRICSTFSGVERSRSVSSIRSTSSPPCFARGASCRVPCARRRCAAPRWAKARTSLSHAPRYSMLIGAHVSTSGGLVNAHERGRGDRRRRDPDLGPVAAHVEAHVAGRTPTSPSSASGWTTARSRPW